jgi:hypothetical protein
MTPTSRLSLLWQKSVVNRRNALDIKVILGQPSRNGWLRADAKKRKPRFGEAGFSEPTAFASWGGGTLSAKGNSADHTQYDRRPAPSKLGPKIPQ